MWWIVRLVLCNLVFIFLYLHKFTEFKKIIVEKRQQYLRLTNVKKRQSNILYYLLLSSSKIVILIFDKQLIKIYVRYIDLALLSV